MMKEEKGLLQVKTNLNYEKDGSLDETRRRYVKILNSSLSFISRKIARRTDRLKDTNVPTHGAA